MTSPAPSTLTSAPLLTPAEALDLNAHSLDPVPAHIFNLQYTAAAEHPDGFVAGLRAANGQWLSLAGGWRQNRTTLLQWQTNAAGHERLSLGTAFRAFLLEHEVARGTEHLALHNSTSHSMHHAFIPAHAVDLLLRRPTRYAAAATRLLPLLAAGRGNFLADALASANLLWQTC